MGSQTYQYFPPLHLLGCHTFLLLTITITINYSMMPTMVGAAHLSNETDRQALLAFKDEISNDPHKVMNSWNASLHFCRWQGVSCGRKHQRVTALHLSTLGLAGRISPHLANLSFLRNLSLRNNSFHGEIPQEMGRLFRLRYLRLKYNSLQGVIPASLSNCSHLRVIDLTHNKLVGEVPTELSLLSNLTVFYLTSNNFTGVFPPFLANLSSLNDLALTSNNFHGAIPEELGMLSGFKFLLLTSNSFVGKLPATIYNLSKLEWLTVDDNQLSGNISPHAGYLFPNLRVFSGYMNQFTGTIPNSLCNASHLEEVDFSHNHFVGSIPIDLGKLQNLYWISFWGNDLGTDLGNDLLFITSLTNCSMLEALLVDTNKLNGPLPTSIANLSSSLTQLYLGKNPIYGRIPSGIENILSLQLFVLQRSFLTGPIPDGIGELPQLVGLYLYENNLSGEIPASLGNLSHLVKLSLYKNQLEGSIPPSLGNCSSLQGLFLSDNNLNGNLPSQLFNLRSLITFDLSRNLLSGNLPLEVGQLSNMNNLDLSDNKLSGEIPIELGECSSLIELNFSHNSIAGTIPMSLGNLRASEVVDFSNNNLSGSIPKYFTRFPFLHLLNLSFNDLEGEVSNEGQFRNASIISVTGNSKLCGGILELHLPTCREHGRKKLKSSFLLKILLPLAVGTCIVIFSCCILVWYWRKHPDNKQIPPASINEQHMKVTYAELYRATNRFSSDNLIGSGSFGSVFKGTLDSYQMDIAIKVIRIEHTCMQSFTAECETLKQIRHRNVVKILTSCSSLDFQGKEFKALVFKFMLNGNLEMWLHPNAGQDLYLSLKKRLDVAIDIAQALDYLHNHCETPIVHCDLKPNNILLDEDMVAHVSDFGLAKILSVADGDSSCTSILKGSIGYIPPEYGSGCKVTTQGDMYSYGVLLLELFMGKRPTDENFTDGINISKHAEMLFQERLLEIGDPRLLLKENANSDVNIRNCLLSVIKIGILCAAEFPQDRMNIRDVCIKLQVVRDVYNKSID